MAAIFCSPPGPVGLVQPDGQRIDLALESADLIYMGLGNHRALAQFADELGRVQILLGQDELGFFDCCRQLVAVIFSRLQLAAGRVKPPSQRLDLTVERDDPRLLRIARADSGHLDAYPAYRK